MARVRNDRSRQAEGPGDHNERPSLGGPGESDRSQPDEVHFCPRDLAERKALEGRWMNDDGDVAEVRMLKSGEMQFGGLEWDEEGQRYRAESVRFTVTTLRRTD